MYNVHLPLRCIVCCIIRSLLHIMQHFNIIPLTKATAAQNEDALSYHRVRGLYFQAVAFVATIYFLHLLQYRFFKASHALRAVVRASYVISARKTQADWKYWL